MSSLRAERTICYYTLPSYCRYQVAECGYIILFRMTNVEKMINVGIRSQEMQTINTPKIS